MKEKKITFEDLQRMKDAVGEPPLPTSITVIANSVVPDHIMIVSPRMFEALKPKGKTTQS